MAHSGTGSERPRVVKEEFHAFLQCGILAQGFLSLPELQRRGTKDYRRHSGAGGDREGPEPPGIGPSAAAQG